MSAIVDKAPNPFGGFAPFPNSIMIPFMGAQSAVLGFQFGIQYELAKRYIKSLSNEDFNNMVNQPNHEFLNSIIKTQALEQITNFRNLIPDYQSLQNDVIEESVRIELKKAERTPSAIAEIIEAFTQGASEQPLVTKLNDWLLNHADPTQLPQFLNSISSISPTLGWLALLGWNGTDTPDTQPEPKDPLEVVTFGFDFTWTKGDGTVVNESFTIAKDKQGHIDLFNIYHADSCSANCESGGTAPNCDFYRKLLPLYRSRYLEWYGETIPEVPCGTPA
jgi:hypothetical protein